VKQPGTAATRKLLWSTWTSSSTCGTWYSSSSWVPAFTSHYPPRY